MEKLRVSRYEMETIILFNEEEPTATVYTHSHPLKKRLDQLVGEFPDYYKVIAQDERATTYEMPKDRLSILSMSRKLYGDHSKGTANLRRNASSTRE